MSCPHCKNWGVGRCDDAHCDIAGPGAPGKRECRLCWLRLGNPPKPVGTAVAPPTVSKPVLLGDAIESALSAVGITKERVSEWLGKPCGCAEKQKKLNQIHQWAKDTKSAAVEAARGWLAKIIGE